jgi:hypothetical protein
MISRMITTVIATGPMFLTISVRVNSLPPAWLADGLAACQNMKSKPNVFVPRMLVRIVTVTPPKGFNYIDSLPAVKTERWQLSAFLERTSAPELFHCAKKL